ncbi:hypothetical protein H0H93_002321, partial [Arthromyces matolae]
MRFILSVLVALNFVLQAVTVPIQPTSGETHRRYIVKLHPNVVTSSFIAATNISTVYEHDVVDGFAAALIEDKVDDLRSHPNVDCVVEDNIVNALILKIMPRQASSRILDMFNSLLATNKPTWYK